MSGVIRLQDDLDTSIRLSWELIDTHGPAGVRRLSSRAPRDSRELSTAECRALIDEFGRVGVCYVDIGGGEPTLREDFWDLLDYATGHRVSIGFSTSGIRITPAAAAAIATSGRVDVRILLDGPDEVTADKVGGPGSFRAAVRAMELLASSGVYDFDLSVVVTRGNVGRLDAFLAIADLFGARLRLSLPRSPGRHDEQLLPAQHRDLHRWLCDHAEQVRAGDGLVSLSGDGKPLLRGSAVGGAEPVACLIDSVGDVYIRQPSGYTGHKAGNVRARGGFERVWRDSARHAREDVGHTDRLPACS